MAPNNSLPISGNEKTMNLNHLILTNIQSSPYFKVNLYELKTYHEVIDEIYYKVSHLEPWEKGSRKTAGQTGMCGGVRGVGAGGIVSSAFCLLYKLFTLRLTRKQVIGLCTHNDSPYIRALGFMYIRYTQPPADFWDWYEEYLEDEEEVDVKAGGGHSMTVGEMLRQWLVKLEWYATLFPRIPVPVQKMIEQKMKVFIAAHGPLNPTPAGRGGMEERGRGQNIPESDRFADSGRPGRRADSPGRRSPADRRPTPPFDIARMFAKDDKSASSRSHRSRSRERKRSHSKERHRSSRHRSRSRDRKHRRSRSRSKDRDRKRKHRRSRSKDKRSRSRESHRHKHKHHSSSKESGGGGGKESSFERDLRKEKDRQKRKDY